MPLNFGSVGARSSPVLLFNLSQPAGAMHVSAQDGAHARAVKVTLFAQTCTPCRSPHVIGCSLYAALSDADQCVCVDHTALVMKSPVAVMSPPAKDGGAAAGIASSHADDAVSNGPTWDAEHSMQDAEPSASPQAHSSCAALPLSPVCETDARPQQSNEATGSLAGGGQPSRGTTGPLPRNSNIGALTSSHRSTFSGFATGRGSKVRIAEAAAARLSKLFAGEEDLFAGRALLDSAAEAVPMSGGHSTTARAPAQDSLSTGLVLCGVGTELPAGGRRGAASGIRPAEDRDGQQMPCRFLPTGFSLTLAHCNALLGQPVISCPLTCMLR